MKYIIAFILILCSIAQPALAAGENTNVATFTNTANKNLVATDSASLSVTGTLSLQFAVKFAAAAAADDEGIFGMYGTAAQRSYFLARQGSTDKLQFIIHDSAGSRTDYFSSALTRDVWYCVLIVFIPSTSVTIYTDSGCDAEPVQDTTDTTGIPANIRNSTENFYIGAFGAFPASAANVYDGKLDDLRIWAENHNDSADYNCQIVGNETNLNAYWQFNNSLLDETANNNDLTNNGSVDLSSTDTPFANDCGGGAVRRIINIQ